MVPSYSGSEPIPLRVAGGGPVVAEYVTEPVVDPQRGPRPFLHPVRTLSGVVVTDVVPEDHTHHLGVSVAMQDVNGVNLWGGRTYVRDQGYQWLDDHARIVQETLTAGGHSVAGSLRWLDTVGATLLDETRVMNAEPVNERAWRLDFAYALRNPGPADVSLGSPGTNGRPGNAGYGGFFWRLPFGANAPTVFSPDADTEQDVNGSAADWIAVTSDNSGSAYSLIFEGLGEGDRWFVRAAEYPGVCVALAFEERRRIAAGDALRRRHRITVVDGAVTLDEVTALIR
ncbi:PmoA family protein [Luedemannella helvata]|uniref:PmoA family protein n=1 Tax=Luedemannella helvata TaxID=349315 RepID=A0ABP4WWB1_9ACTN